MNQPKIYLNLLIFAVLVCGFASISLAQTEEKLRTEPNFDITLQIVVGTNDSGRSELPKDLNSISQQLRSIYPYTTYRVANTYMGRVGNNGSFEYKSLADLLGQQPNAANASFLEWSVGNLRVSDNAFVANSFRFGARIPVNLAVAGAPGNATTYESIGLNLARVGVTVGTPTLLGTLTLPKTDGTLFLVMTAVRSDH